MTDSSRDGKLGSKAIDDGDFDTRSVQTNGRINLPEGYMDYLGVDDSDQIAVIAKEGRLVLTRANMGDISRVRDSATPD